MNNKSFLIIITQSLLILVLIWLLILVSKDELFNEEELEDEVIVDYTLNESGLTYVVLSEAVEKNSRIQTQPIAATSFEKEISSHGEILDTNELIEASKLIKKNYFLLNKLTAQIKEEREHLEKFIKLNNDNKNIADKVVHEQEILVNNLNNEYSITESELQSIKNSVRYNWGEYFVKLITNENSKKNCLILNQCSLAQVTIDRQKFDQKLPNSISLFNTNDQTNYQGSLIGPSPKLNRSIQGESFYYLVENILVPSGSKLMVKLSSEQANTNYLFIPKEAVVWSHGKPWVYIRDPNVPKFLRKPLQNPHETENGWLINQEDLLENDFLVTDGAQLLLSEEFKYQIKNENED